MRRREFIGALAASAFLPQTAMTQSVPLVGILNSGAPTPFTDGAFEAGLREVGFTRGQNVRIETRWSQGNYEQLPALAADLIHQRPDVLLTGGTPAARVGKAASGNANQIVPMVFAMGSDPVAEGLVTSLSRPGGHLTGITSMAGALAPKRMELGREFLRSDRAVALLINPGNPLAVVERGDSESAARAIGQGLEVLTARNDAEIETAFASLQGRRIAVLMIAVDTYFFARMRQMAQLAERYGIPAIGPLREFAASGGLMSYGASIGDVNRLAGVYAGKVLAGTKPADLPVLQPTKFELVLNLRSAKALGIEFSPKLLALADEVIE
jgi:putative ABC transport system substrate-binding protein